MILEFIILKILLLFTKNIHGIDSQITTNSGIHNNINKCCPAGKYVATKKTCVNYNGTLSFSNIKVYDKDIYDTGKLLEDVFTLVPKKFGNVTFKAKVIDVIAMDYNVYLTEDGVIQVELPNMYNRWRSIPQGNYCIDYRIKENPDSISLGFWAILLDESESTQNNPFLTPAMLISCFFMLLVLIVYCLLPELRNLAGMILMAYIASLFMAFLLLVVIQKFAITITVCISLTCSIYFFFLATFCWMSVMSYDIWWTFRGYVEARSINRRGERFKFLMYCLYAWGVPLAMTIGLAVLNSINMRHLPWFVTPRIPEYGCFLQGGVKLLYLYIPMLILIICNWIFYLITAINIWQSSRYSDMLYLAAAGNSQTHRALMRRFVIYMKLSVVMGLNWLLEIVSYRYPGYNLWYLTDAYNILIGLAMFLIFVCKKKIWKKLCKRYVRRKTTCGNSLSKSSSRGNSSSKSSSRGKSANQETTSSLQPNGLNEYALIPVRNRIY